MRPQYKACSKTPWRLAGCWLQHFCRSRREHSARARRSSRYILPPQQIFLYNAISRLLSSFSLPSLINICTFRWKNAQYINKNPVSYVPSVVLALGWHGRLLDYLIKSMLMWILTCWHYSHGLGSSEKNNILVISSFPSQWKIIRSSVDIKYPQ